jgi:hypothetical protein
VKKTEPKDRHPIDDLLEQANARGLRLFVAAEIAPLADLRTLRLFQPKSPEKAKKNRGSRR